MATPSGSRPSRVTCSADSIPDVKMNLVRALDVVSDAAAPDADAVLFPKAFLQSYRADELPKQPGRVRLPTKRSTTPGAPCCPGHSRSGVRR
jgi:predicted amidohydrolase